MITTKNLSMQFKNESAIRYRDLVFETGKSYLILGASGCGKSTLLNLIAGVLTPTGGEVYIDDVLVSSLSQQKKDKLRIQKIGYIYQDFKLIPEMTVLDNIRILNLEGIDTSRAEELLNVLGIGDKKNKKIKNLSGGEKQRVAVVRALVKDPDIILADEPTGNLNYTIGEQVVEELSRAAKGKTLIVVSHDERLVPFFDQTIDMNEITGSMESSENGGAAV
ncbi:MAG: ABC transporter ATP-binding protein [Clostridia bacterium]|nr:ABC transporter ATP-binding protein [Clostridia bacterium]